MRDNYTKPAKPMTDTLADRIRERSREQFRCVQCAGSGRVMMGALTSVICPKCDGFGARQVKVDEICAFTLSELSFAEKAARKDELERCYKILCAECRNAEDLEPASFIDGKWKHKVKAGRGAGYFSCEAASIRNRE